MVVFSEILWLAGPDRDGSCLDYVFLSLPSQMTRSESFFLYWLPLLLYIAIIFGFSSASDVPGAKQFNDKLLHMVEYAVLAFLLWRVLSRNDPNLFSLKLAGTITAAGSICGALDETYQSLTPGRFSSVYDWYADVAGIVGMTTLLYLRYKYRRRVDRSYESN